MDQRLILLGLTGILLSVAHAQTRQYYFVNTSSTWAEAQSICRRNYTDLATIENTADVDAFLRTSLNYTGKAWIGLFDERINSWKWSLNDSSFYGPGEYTFRNWHGGQPDDFYGQQHCVRFYGQGSWDDIGCTDIMPFICYNGTLSGSPSYVVSNISLNWNEAQKFCRANYVDLASIRNQTENELIKQLLNGTTAWIGLYREKLWSDGSLSLFRHWADGEPNNPYGDQCAAGSFNDTGRWLDEECSLSLPFVCYRKEEQAPSCSGCQCCPSGTECNTTNGSFECIDPCLNYITLNDPWRSRDNRNNTILHCDRDIFWSGWYRFYLGQISAQIPNECIEVYRCGTNAPLWINGAQPTQLNEIVNRTVCLTWAGSCCGFETHTIQVKLCNGYYVYKLQQPSGCHMAYCAEPSLFRVLGQDETSITLQWDKLNSTSFVLQFNGTETNISALDENGPVNHTVSSLSAGTKYMFTLFYLFGNVRGSGIQLTAVTAPRNADGLSKLKEDETSITLQWNKVNNNVSFLLQFNGKEKYIWAPDGNGSVTYTASYLTAGTKYTFTLFSVFESIRSSGVQILAVTAPRNAEGFKSLSQNESSVTLQWDFVGYNISFILQYNETMFNVVAPAENRSLSLTVPSLTPGTRYLFTLYSVFENIRSSGVRIAAATAPENAEGFRLLRQNETSITLHWDPVKNNISFIVHYNGNEINVAVPAGNGPVTLTVSSLTPGTIYLFTLFSVFENVGSSGVSIAAVTAPENADGVRASNQNETSITLQWNKINNNVSFVLQFNGTETNITATDGNGPITHTVSFLTARTYYTFTLFSVFKNVRSSGVSFVAATGPNYVLAMKMRLQLPRKMSELEMEDALVELFRTYNLPSQLSVKITSSKP